MRARKPTGYEVSLTYGVRETVMKGGCLSTAGTGGGTWFAVSMRQVQSIIAKRLKQGRFTALGERDHQFRLTPIYGPMTAPCFQPVSGVWA